MQVIRSGQKNLALVKFHLPRLIRDAGLRSCDSGARRHVPVIGAIKNHNVLRIRDREQIPFWIDSQPDDMSKAGLGSLDHANWRSVSMRVPAKNIDTLSRQAGDQNLLILQVK